MSGRTRQDQVRGQTMRRVMGLGLVALVGCVALLSHAVSGPALGQTTAALRPQTHEPPERPPLPADGVPATPQESPGALLHWVSFWAQYTVAVVRRVPTIITDGIACVTRCVHTVAPRQRLALLPGEHHTGAERRDSEVRQRFVLHTDDDIQATHDLLLFLQHHGFEAQLYAHEFISIIYHGESFLLAPMVKRGALSRIVVAQVFDITQEYRHTAEIMSYITQLHTRVDFATFYLSQQADRVIMQSHITFVDQVDEKEVRQFLEFFRTGFTLLLEAVPETAKYFH